MKTIILYKSKYGATRQYAEWLSLETGVPAIPIGEFDVANLSGFDTVILGTSVYIGKLLISNWLAKNWYALQNKRLELFLVSGTPQNEREKLIPYVRSSVPKEIFNQLSLTFLHGKLVMKELSWLDRLLVRMGSRIAEKKNPADKIIMDYNDVKKEHLKPLIEKFKKAM